MMNMDDSLWVYQDSAWAPLLQWILDPSTSNEHIYNVMASNDKAASTKSVLPSTISHSCVQQTFSSSPLLCVTPN